MKETVIYLKFIDNSEGVSVLVYIQVCTKIFNFF